MNKGLFDCHIHIGQYENIYYQPYKVIEILSSCGISGAYVSSTTSCMNWNTNEEKNLIVTHIRDEFVELKDRANSLNFDARPLCWIIPKRYFEGDSLESIFRECEYRGFKIHPRAHEWDLSDYRINILMDEICNYAEKNDIPIIIHTGICGFESPEKFEEWYYRYPNVSFILAHCKADESMIKMFEKYENVYGDVAFNSVETFLKITEKGFSKKILYGSDFPITDFMYGKKKSNKKALCKEYRELLASWKNYISSMATIDNLNNKAKLYCRKNKEIV